MDFDGIGVIRLKRDIIVCPLKGRPTFEREISYGMLVVTKDIARLEALTALAFNVRTPYNSGIALSATYRVMHSAILEMH